MEKTREVKERKKKKGKQVDLADIYRKERNVV